MCCFTPRPLMVNRINLLELFLLTIYPRLQIVSSLAVCGCYVNKIVIYPHCILITTSR